MRSLVVALLVMPCFADASPITAGASLGITQDEAASQLQPDHNESLFARLGLTPRLAAQIELSKIDASDRGLTDLEVRTANVLAVLDLGSRGHLVPILLAGAGYDRATEGTGTGEIDAHHLEAGIGLEYRADGGLVIGADARLGDRTIDSNSFLVPLACCTLWSQPMLSDGQYRSARVTLGVRF